MEAANHSKNSAMEAENHVKHGTSSMNKGNFLRKTCFALLAAGVIFSANSCKSLDYATLSPKMKNDKLLPPLTPTLDVASLGSVFPITQSVGSGYVGYGTVSVYTSTHTNPVMNDLDVIFQRDISTNICDGLTGTAKGSINCRAVVGKERRPRTWLVISGLTLCIPNLFGMPFGSSTAELQIEVTIFDGNNNIAGRYTSDIHKQKSYMAMYWGYSESDVYRKNARFVFTACMEDIKQQISRDYDRLIRTLQ